jgi:hypothetical protein
MRIVIMYSPCPQAPDRPCAGDPGNCAALYGTAGHELPGSIGDAGAQGASGGVVRVCNSKKARQPRTRKTVRLHRPNRIGSRKVGQNLASHCCINLIDPDEIAPNSCAKGRMGSFDPGWLASLGGCGKRLRETIAKAWLAD